MDQKYNTELAYFFLDQYIWKGIFYPKIEFEFLYPHVAVVDLFSFPPETRLSIFVDVMKKAK